MLSGQQFDVGEQGGLPVVSAPAEIDIGNAGWLRSALLAAASINSTIVVDLSATGFCDSSGLNVLVRALRRAQADGGEVRLVTGQAAILRILAVTGVDSIIPVYASVAEAIAGPEPKPQPPELTTTS